MIENLKKLFLAGIFLLSGVTGWSAPPEPAVPQGGDFKLAQQENEYYALLEAECDRFLREIMDNFPAEEQAGWQKIKNAVLLKFKEISKAQEILKTYGKTIAMSTLVGETLSTFILPPILFSMGMPTLAGLFAVTPVGPLSGAALLYYKLSGPRKRLAKELKLESLSSLRALQSDLLGYEMKDRITTVLYQNVQNAMDQVFEIDIVQKYRSRMRHEFSTVISLNELENIVRSQGTRGAAYLSAIFLDKADKPLYTLKLMRFINLHPDLTHQMAALLHLKTSATLKTDLHQIELRKRLIKIDDFKKTIESRRRELYSRVSNLRGELSLKKAPAYRVHLKYLSHWLEIRSAELLEISHAAERAEYFLLHQEQLRQRASTVENAPISSLDFETMHSNLLDVMEETKKWITPLRENFQSKTGPELAVMAESLYGPIQPSSPNSPAGFNRVIQTCFQKALDMFSF